MKTLIISHNPISTYQDMGKTMLTLFEGFDSKELCQLYIYPSVPDTDKCGSYFRITDKDILRSYYKFKVCSEEIKPCAETHEMFADANDERIYRSTKNRRSSRKLARDLMWKCSHWYNKKLKEWLDKENPECIFVAPGAAKFIYDISLKISRKRNIPIVAYVCDDFYFVKKADGGLARLQQRLLHKKMKKLFAQTSHIITICDELKERYSQEFAVPATTIMTGTSRPIAEECKTVVEPRSITYMGNIRCNRYVSLASIGRALDKINEEEGADYSLKIYSSEKDATILSAFDGIDAVSFCGYVGGEEFEKTFLSSDLLLHTEAFDEKSIDMVKLSVSTKIADCLGSGIPLVAYGPECVASMRHLVDNNCAITITSEEDLCSMLKRVFSDSVMRRSVVESALQVARKCHVSGTNSRRVSEIINDVTFRNALN